MLGTETFSLGCELDTFKNHYNDQELGRAGLGKLAVAGMDVHTFHHTEGGEIQVIAYHLEIVVLRHGYSSIYFKFCFR